MRQLGPLRVPVAALVVLLYLPLAANVPAIPGSSLVRGLFDLRALTPDVGVLWTLRTFVTFLAAWLALAVAIVAVYQSGAMIHDFGPARFGTPGIGGWLGLRTWTARLAVAAPALLAIVASLRASLDGRFPPRQEVGVAASLAATTVAILLVGGVTLCNSLRPAQLSLVRRYFDRLAARFDTRGYEDGARAADPFPHHVWAALFLLLSLLVWSGVAFWALFPPIQPWVRVPALCSLYLLVTLGTWGLSSLTFFFDFYRMPILTLLLVPTLLVGVRGYVYEALPATEATRPLLPAEMVEARIGAPSGRVVAIAAAGGGIQAAAWTARVIQGLVEEARDDRAAAFLQRVVVVSGVSGGSVGLAPFVLALDAGRIDLLKLPITRAASTSSIDRVAATWATLDLLPFRLVPDRGLALQNAWMASWDAVGLPTATRLGWLARRDPTGRTLLRAPGVMFNATSMTTGERLIFGTTVPTRPRSAEPSFLQSAVVEHGEKGQRAPEYRPVTVVADIEVGTAARLSATFPLVSPAARCAGCAGLPQYVVDGGYVDNSGVESMAEWLESLLADDAMRNVGVTVVQILPFSDDQCEKQAASRWSPSQAAVPLRTMYGVRGPGQARGSIGDLVDLQREFAGPATPGRVCLHSFAYHRCHDAHGFSPPLSWHLTAGQSEDVRLTWDNKDVFEARKVVEEALSDGAAGCFAGSVQPSRTAPKANYGVRKFGSAARPR